MEKVSRNCFVLFAVALAALVVACGDGSPTGPNINFSPAIPNLESPSQPTTPTSTPTDPGDDSDDNENSFTILSRAEVQMREDCSQNDPGWFLPDGYNVTVRINKNLDHNFRMVSNVFWAPEPNCQPTNDQMGRGSSWERDEKFLKASFDPAKNCGRYQWDLKAINENTGESIDVFFGVLNTGNESCTSPPPPPGCPANDDSFIVSEDTEGDGYACFLISWGSSQKPCSIFEDGQLFSSQCNGQTVACYDQEESGNHTWRLKAGECDPTTVVTVEPPGNPCDGSFLDLDAEIVGNTLYIYTNSSTSGVANALGVDVFFGSGQQTNTIPVPSAACGQKIKVKASNQCEDKSSITVNTDDCPEPECVLPEEGFYEDYAQQLDQGNPATECSSVGLVPTENQVADLYMVKCGQDYQFSYGEWDQGTCGGGNPPRAVSHITSCVCPTQIDPPVLSLLNTALSCQSAMVGTLD